MELNTSYEQCRALHRQHGRTYYLATLLLPAAKRPAVHALYAFARHADDLVDTLDPAATIGSRDRALANYVALRELTSVDDRAAADLDDPQLSFQLAQGLPDLDFLHALQRQRSETGRLKQLNQYLEQYIPRQRSIERVKAVAPTNGFGGKHAEL